jgi:cholest-4-en-3-one 26-monooxygenase
VTTTATSTPPMAIDLLDGDFWAGDFHRAFRWLREHDSVSFDGRVWGVAPYELVREVSRRPGEFCSSGGSRPDADPVPMMLDMDDPEHVRLRKRVNRGFSPRRVSENQADVRRVCNQILDGVIETGSCDFVTDVAAWLPLIVIGDALGFPQSRFADLLRWSDDCSAGSFGHADPERLAAVGHAYTSFGELVVPAIEQRRRKPTDDLLSVLVHAEVDGHRLDDEEIIHESLLILIGGDETTRHVISGGLYQLLRHPEQLAELRRDRSLLPSAVEEMLRWTSPVRTMNRTTTAEVELAGTAIPAGAKVVLLYPSANRDADAFPDPDRFDIHRTPNDHLAFGFGTHHCLGANLARLELRVMFDSILDRMHDIELGRDQEPTNRATNFVSGYETMPIRFAPGPRTGTSA